VRLAALVLVALALTACESNQERSAQIEKYAKPREAAAARQRELARQALTITRQSTKVKVIDTAVVSSSESAAALVTLRNVSATALRDVPIQIVVRNAHGASLYTNDVTGLSATLASVGLIPAHGVVTWIDDQVQGARAATSVTAKVGEGTAAAGAIPKLAVAGVHLAEAGEAEGNVVNSSSVDQQELVVDAVARRAGKIVAAGRAVLATAGGGTTTPFQVFFVGNPSGAKLEVSAPATTTG
jgi:hypothetical protein